MTGSTDGTSGHAVYENDGGGFIERHNVLGTAGSSVLPGGHNRNSDLNMLVAGHSSMLAPRSRLYQNQGATTTNEPPSHLSVSVEDSTVVLSWSRGTDDRTPANGLTYNLRVGTEPGGGDVVFAAANSKTGRRLKVGRGNRDSAVQMRLEGLAPGRYYWSVQSVDHSYSGSMFAEEGTFAYKYDDISSDPEGVVPLEMALHPSYPNPFSGETTLRYTVHEAGSVTITVFNILGARVLRLVDGVHAAGVHRLVWDGRDAGGRRLGSGVYYASMQSAGTMQVLQLTIIR